MPVVPFNTTCFLFNSIRVETRCPSLPHHLKTRPSKRDQPEETAIRAGWWGGARNQRKKKVWKGEWRQNSWYIPCWKKFILPVMAMLAHEKIHFSKDSRQWGTHLYIKILSKLPLHFITKKNCIVVRFSCHFPGVPWKKLTVLNFLTPVQLSCIWGARPWGSTLGTISILLVSFTSPKHRQLVFYIEIIFSIVFFKALW